VIATSIALGVDVGLHFVDVVVLDGATVEHRRVAADGFAAVLEEARPAIVGIDSPAGWAARGGARASETALIAAGIRCFRTPTADRVSSSFYDWVRTGHAVFATCVAHGFAVGRALPLASPCAIEVFPHATALALLDAPYATKRPVDKLTARRSALARAGIAVPERWSIDAVDAALAAYTARAARAGDVRAYGDEEEGQVFVPRLAPRPI
jgi:predicted nuclease with RNAse H fold